MEPVRSLFDTTEDVAPSLPGPLRHLYGGHLSFPRGMGALPYVIGNFVSTLDGVVSYRIPGHAGGSTISGSNPGDRFIMGLLRASADAVIVGSRTVHDISPQGLWVPEHTYPGAKQQYTEYRRNVLHKPQYPTTVIVSGSGRLELERAVFRTPEIPVVIITTLAGQEELARRGVRKLASVVVRPFDVAGAIGSRAILQFLYSQFGVRMLLHEGGPTLFGQFLAAQMINELFLTVSPQIAGRTRGPVRPAIVEGVEFTPENAPQCELLSVRQQGNHLYLRYRLKSDSSVA